MQHFDSFSHIYKIRRRKKLFALNEFFVGGDGCYICYKRTSLFKNRKRRKMRNWKKYRKTKWRINE